MKKTIKYDHQKIEKKWQKYWKEHKTFKTEMDKSKSKFYVLDMFPYPSGAGLHVGHVTGYTGTDIIARFKRQKGFNVLHPIGWDSFGLPAEQYAIRTGTHPAITTKQNIDNYRRQMQNLGFSYDWDREFATSDPAYYKWTQWIFTKLYERGLAYEAEINVNYCPALGTVLANEEVENGKSTEGGFPIERMPLKQWVLKITQYADSLIEDLDNVDWPDNLKKLQRNWIGKSEGATIDFEEEKTKEKITVFTTRPDTIFGATYLVLSPEHPLVDKLTTKEQKENVENYKKKTALKSDLERTDLAKEKTGVWTGSYAINPANSKKIPIWLSDYVLMGYGTGSIMAVPAHDDRDFEFAEKFDLPIICVIDPDFSELENEGSEELREAILTGNQCWTKNGKAIFSENSEVSLNGCDVNEAIKRMIDWLEKSKFGKKTISYKLRDWLFSRQRYWGEPFPILNFEDGSQRILGLDELPLCPPEIEDYKPSGNGKSPLAKIKKWVEIVDTKTGKKALRETNTMPQWAGSCWYYLRFCDPKNEKKAWSKEKENYWMPVDLYVGGAEHAVLHLLYARFWHKVLFDCGLVSTNEPFQTYRYQGVVTAPSYKLKGGGYVAPDEVEKKDNKCFYENEEVLEQIEKMSKSKLNGVTPDDIIEEFGADSLRLYEMFMGPFDREKIWNTDAVNGCKRFLNRFYEMVFGEKVSEDDDDEALKLSNKLVHVVVPQIENLQFNTAIAHMMEFINNFTKLSKYPKKALRMVVQMLYPFAPHIAEECWEHLGAKTTITYEPLPKVDKKYLVEDMLTYVVQVNGKVRGRFDLSKDTTEEDLLSLVKEKPEIQKHLEGEIVKTIYVPGKLLNIVIKK